ncbi:SGNH/GDSL hydrolase family protein [Pseudomonas veronii]|uniref:SGNH/GDSL hydrolase family protein n=1 Tax=Pseudomonas veronii TaxID=76761 RepID=A0ABS0VG35_PSEVE|nr:SGNH/GDSL hydrolase family protein [Pseudomonas veronii]MBI6551038.1 SGNH/GDSL hydrolase family protein [Pseudomonas veronii]MBI6649136.1 SGNH/GDSL hydrolase family protein [Pseudomonas veronii]
MTDQTQRLEIATVRAEIGSNITYRFNNDAIGAGGIPTESGDIKNLKLIIKEIEDKASVSTSIYTTVADGLAATEEGGMFLVQSDVEAEIYVVWRKVGGVAVDTGKRALSSQAAANALSVANTKADASAVNSLTTRVTTAEGSISSQGTSITGLTSSLATTNTNVTAAQTAATAANTLAGSKGKVMVQTATPAAADQLVQNLWIDITSSANTPKRWNGSAWAAVTDKVATDAAAAAANALSVANTKADASAVNSLTTRVTTAEGSISSQGTSITGLTSSLATTIQSYGFGLEYLYAFHTKLLAQTVPVKVTMSGDSTTNGAGSVSPYTPAEQLSSALAERGVNCTVLNRGHDGNSTADWVDNWVAADAAENPDLYIIRWGMNDTYYGRSIAQFEASLRAGLTIYRSTRGLTTNSILLMPPNAADAVPWGTGIADAAWGKACNEVAKLVARDFSCAYLDVYSWLKDGAAGAGRWLDGTVGGHNGVHPKPVMNAVITDFIAEFAVPKNLRPRVPKGVVKTVTGSDLPATFPVGWSVYHATGFASITPGAWVRTFRSADGFCIQEAYAEKVTGNYYSNFTAARLGDANSNVWHGFHTQPPQLIPLESGWSSLAGVTGSAPYAAISNNVVTLGGIASKAGAVAAQEIIGILHWGFRPLVDTEWYVVVDNASPTGVLRIKANGEIIHWNPIANTGANWVSLSGVSFIVGT